MKPQRERWFIGLASVTVALVAFGFRLPSCGESFWLDELHSAWAIDGSFRQVAGRAALGNQTTGYFHLLWVWSALVGQGEVALRLSSVLASSLAAGCLVAGVAWRTRRLAGGVFAGLMFAVDPNAVFFGCELRSYSFVMLYAVLATLSAMVWLGAVDSQAGESTGTSYGGARWRLSMLFWICVAALVHPTSFGILAWLIPLTAFDAYRTGRMRLWRADFVAAGVVVGTLGALAVSSLPDSWEQRDLWRAFGLATDWRQLWRAWDWVPILIVPLSVSSLALLTTRLVGKPGSHDPAGSRQLIGMIPGIAALTGTVSFFLASYFEIIPLWHRRYFVAALPLLAWTAGECVSLAVSRLHYLPVKRSVGAFGGAAMVLVLIGFQLWYQGSLTTLRSGQIPLQLRGESWREAVELVRERIEPGDTVWLDSQLIETQFLRRPVSESGDPGEAEWDYLRFPLDGPYDLSPVVVVDCYEHDTWIRAHASSIRPEVRSIWLVSRSGRQGIDRFLERLNQTIPCEFEVLYRGRPQVIRLRFPEFSRLKAEADEGELI